VNGRLLSRHAECAFWLARYLERAESLARILEVHTSFRRGQAGGTNWGWIVALYGDEEHFYKRFPDPSAANVIRYYATDLENPSSLLANVRAARENARALRALIPTEMWTQINDFYSRLLTFSENDFSETRLSRSCDVIKRGCYGGIGVAESTFYRDEIWPFFYLGLIVERADQTSRLLDLQFARQSDGAPKAPSETQSSLWSALLRSASAYHAFRRVHTSGFDPQTVARFLIFDTRLPRSIAFCAGEIQRTIAQLRGEFHLRRAQRPLEHVASFFDALREWTRNDSLLAHLHEFNDWIQSELIVLTAELGVAFFGHQAQPKGAAEPALMQEQSQS
jgi:uncharacterized alpha-E superfamily protein